MYRIIDTKIWTDPKIKKLSIEEKTVFVYLITNQHTHLSGIYILPKAFISYEIGVSNRVLDRVYDTLSELDLIKFDSENDVIFIKNMFRYQGKGQKNEISAAKHLETLHNSLLIFDFLDINPNVKKYCSDRVLDRVSIGYEIRSHTGTGTGTEKDIAQSFKKSSEQQPKIPKENIFLSIPLKTSNGSIPYHHITFDELNKYKALYPYMDVEQALRSCCNWNEANKQKRKTPKGILRHIGLWLEKGYNKNQYPKSNQSTQKIIRILQ